MPWSRHSQARAAFALVASGLVSTIAHATATYGAAAEACTRINPCVNDDYLTPLVRDIGPRSVGASDSAVLSGINGIWKGLRLRFAPIQTTESIGFIRFRTA